MVDKPRNPRRAAGGDNNRPGRPFKAGGPGERPAPKGRLAGKPGKAPAGPRQIAGVDARAMEVLEREGLLTAEGRKLRAGAVQGRQAERREAIERGARPTRKPAEGGPARKPAGPARRGPARLNQVEKLVAERLQKVMAQAGVASRRHSEELIQAGRVTVNGRVVTELGTKVVPGQDLIEVDGRALGQKQELVYILMYKPKGYVTTLFDPQGRPKVVDLLDGEIGERVYPVGRLDFDTEGLLLLTNDGELANQLMHPAKMVKKTYIAKVRGVPGPAKIRLLETGIELEDGMTAPAELKMIEVRPPNSATVSIRIHEGRNRQVRRMLEAVGHEVIHLKRTTLGPLTLKGLEVGEWRHLSQQEVLDLRRAAGVVVPRGAVVAAVSADRQGGRPAVRRSTGRFGRQEPGMDEQAETAPRGDKFRPAGRPAAAPAAAPARSFGGPRAGARGDAAPGPRTRDARADKPRAGGRSEKPAGRKNWSPK